MLKDKFILVVDNGTASLAARQVGSKPTICSKGKDNMMTVAKNGEVLSC